MPGFSIYTDLVECCICFRIQEFIERGNQQISALISKIRQIEILRVQLQEIVGYVEAKKLLE